MTAHSIKMIADSLRNCSLNGRRRAVRAPPVKPPPSPESSEEEEEEEEVTVELNSGGALPHDWQQCLDLRSGQVYYVNFKTGARTAEDPRLINGYYYSSSEYDVDDDEDDSSDDEDDTSDSSNPRSGGDNYFSGGEFSSSGDSSSSSAYSPEVTSPEVTSADSQVLVAAGCRFCFMYFMVPKRDLGCPKCGRLLLNCF